MPPSEPPSERADSEDNEREDREGRAKVGADFSPVPTRKYSHVTLLDAVRTTALTP
jgi:hypothetical protein